MKELNTFRQFISEDKVSEDKIEKVIKDTLKKEGGASGLDPLKKAVKALNVDTDLDVEKFISKMDDVEKHKDGDYILTPLKENDIVLDEVINEGLDAKTKKYLYNTAGGFLDSTYFDDVKVGDELKFTFNAVR